MAIELKELIIKGVLDETTKPKEIHENSMPRKEEENSFQRQFSQLLRLVEEKNER